MRTMFLFNHFRSLDRLLVFAYIRVNIFHGKLNFDEFRTSNLAVESFQDGVYANPEAPEHLELFSKLDTNAGL